jgi:hypothetical protein
MISRSVKSGAIIISQFVFNFEWISVFYSPINKTFKHIICEDSSNPAEQKRNILLFLEINFEQNNFINHLQPTQFFKEDETEIIKTEIWWNKNVWLQWEKKLK